MVGERSHLYGVAGVKIELVNFVVAAPTEQHVLLVFVRVQLGNVKHLAGSDCTDDLMQETSANRYNKAVL